MPFMLERVSLTLPNEVGTSVLNDPIADFSCHCRDRSVSHCGDFHMWKMRGHFLFLQNGH